MTNVRLQMQHDECNTTNAMSQKQCEKCNMVNATSQVQVQEFLKYHLDKNALNERIKIKSSSY